MKNIWLPPTECSSCVPDLADISDARTDCYILSPHTFAANFGLNGLIYRSIWGLNFARHLRRLDRTTLLSGNITHIDCLHGIDGQAHVV